MFCAVAGLGENAEMMPGGLLTDRIAIGVLTRLVPRYLVDEVLAETGRREKRSRLLPAHVVVYFVMAMAIFRDGYEEVMRRLTGGLAFMRAWRRDWAVPTTGAISQARERLGEAPVRVLFERVAAPLAAPGAPGAWLGSRRLMAIDGVKLDVPDTPADVAGFGRPGGVTRRPFPQIQVLGLGECGTHAVVAARIGTLSVGERELAAGLADVMEAGMLVIADRGFFSFELWRDCLLTGADLLFRVASGLKLPVTRILPDGSWLSEAASPKVRSSGFQVPLAAAGDPRNATHIPVRVIEYTVAGSAGAVKPETFRLVTTILDPDDVTAIELAAAYQQRWEYEISLREIETHMLDPGTGLRSKSPELVRQELWGLLLAHYAIRALMAEAAASAGLDPDRLSFMRSISLVRRQVTDQAAFPPRRLECATTMAIRKSSRGSVKAAANAPTPASSRNTKAAPTPSSGQPTPAPAMNRS
jgi:Insertion element 4 transposase N-terminal/Transposase DDE domain